jgi:hypothetical protein
MHLSFGREDGPEIFTFTARQTHVLAEVRFHAIVLRRQEDFALTEKNLLPKRYWGNCRKSSHFLRLHSYNS